MHIFTIEGEEPTLEETQEVAENASFEGQISEELEETLSQAIEDMDLTSRAVNCLKAEGIKTVRDLVSKTEDQLKLVKNFGSKSFDEVKEKLAKMKLELGMKL